MVWRYPSTRTQLQWDFASAMSCQSVPWPMALAIQRRRHNYECPPTDAADAYLRQQRSLEFSDVCKRFVLAGLMPSDNPIGQVGHKNVLGHHVANEPAQQQIRGIFDAQAAGRMRLAAFRSVFHDQFYECDALLGHGAFQGPGVHFVEPGNPPSYWLQLHPP